ncbi:hypothetical protein ACQ4PT_053501 [Festuca glaucescens]
MASEEELLIHEFNNMVQNESEAHNPTSLFEDWSDDKKIKYMKQLQVNLPNQSEATDLDQMDVPDSVLFDITDDEKAHSNYISSVGHYRSWQYAGSDRRYQFGSKRNRAFLTRSSGVFVFYFRYKHLTVGLIVDGQTGWVEGAITNNNGRESVLQFARKPFQPDYIRSLRTHNLKYDGNYTGAGKTYEAKVGIWPVRDAIVATGSYIPRVTESEPEPIHWQILILFSVEAGRLNHVFARLSLSIENGPYATLKLPTDGEQFILNYLKLSLCANETIEGRPFVHVKGTTPRNLYQVLLEILILRRENLYPTYFILPDAPPLKYQKNEPRRGSGSKQLSLEQQLKDENAKGTTYTVGKHDATVTYHCEDWLINPFKEDRMSVQHRFANGSPSLNGHKNILVAEIMRGDAAIVMPKILELQEGHDLHKLGLTQGQMVAQQCVGSGTSLEAWSVRDQWYCDGQFHKKDLSATGGVRGGGRSSMLKSGVATRTGHALTQVVCVRKKLRSSTKNAEELRHDEPRRRLHMALGADNGQVPKMMKRSIARETDNMHAQNKKAKLMAAVHEETSCVNSSIQGDLFGKLSGFGAILEGGAHSRTAFVTNVHLAAATKEALSIPFMNCGAVLKFNMLRDAVTAWHPKGDACVTFDDKESTEKAISLSWTSRFATVTRTNRLQKFCRLNKTSNLYCPYLLPGPLPASCAVTEGI